MYKFYMLRMSLRFTL